MSLHACCAQAHCESSRVLCPGLLDRKWIDQRDRINASKRDNEEVYAAGSAIDSSLKQLAERRTDIFGYGVEERKIGEKVRGRGWGKEWGRGGRGAGQDAGKLVKFASRVKQTPYSSALSFMCHSMFHV